MLFSLYLQQIPQEPDQQNYKSQQILNITAVPPHACVYCFLTPPLLEPTINSSSLVFNTPSPKKRKKIKIKIQIKSPPLWGIITFSTLTPTSSPPTTLLSISKFSGPSSLSHQGTHSLPLQISCTLNYVYVFVCEF